MIAPGLDIGAGHDMEPTDKVPVSIDRVPCTEMYKLLRNSGSSTQMMQRRCLDRPQFE